MSTFSLNKMNANNNLKESKNLISLILIVLLIFIFFYTFLIENQSWYHIESLMSFVSTNSNTKINLIEIILKGTFFDDNPARFRPLSHLIEYIDNYSKFFLFKISLDNTIYNSVSNYFFIFFSACVLFYIFKECGFSSTSSIFLVLLIFSSTAFLSTFAFAFRPAKKIVIFISFCSFLNFLQYKKKKYNKYLYKGIFYNFLLLVTDEEGWYLSFVFTLFYLLDKNFIVKKLSNTKIEIIYINLISYLSIITYTLIWPRSYFNNLYTDSSIIQQSSVIINLEKFKLYFNLILENFFSGFVGLVGYYSSIIYIFTFLLFFYLFYVRKLPKLFTKFILIFFLIFGFVTFNTILELVGGNIIMRSLSYYYGSSKIILLFFIIFILFEDLKVTKLLYKNKIFLHFVITCLILFNINNFLNTNKLIKNIHFEKIAYDQFYHNLDISYKARINNNCNFFLNNLIKYDHVTYKAENLILLEKLNINSLHNINLVNSYGVITSPENLLFFFDYLSGCKFSDYK